MVILFTLKNKKLCHVQSIQSLLKTENRKLKKRDFRSLWIVRINAAVRPHGLSYSKFIKKLSDANITINRKVLADLAMNDAKAFDAIVNQVK